MMTTYTSCRDCGRILETTDGQNVHADCNPLLSPLEEAGLRQAIADLQGDEERREYERDEIVAIRYALHHTPMMGEFAVAYARMGWPVFPLKPGEKTPATKHGFKAATTDIAQVKHWWSTNPGFNVGLPTGHLFDVIDVDLQGFDAYKKLDEHGVLADVHGHVATTRGGAHYYIKPTGAGCTVAMIEGVDYRGVGGYVVAPPSRVGDVLDPDANYWSWVSHPSPKITSI